MQPGAVEPGAAVLLEKGLAAYRAGDLYEALRYLGRARSQAPADAAVRRAIADVAIELNAPYAAALSVEPDMGIRSRQAASRVRWGQQLEADDPRQRFRSTTARRSHAISYFVSANGATQPKQWTKNYRLGARWRGQVYRDFLFLSVEPSYSYIRRQYEDRRNGVLGITVRLEVALERDLARR